MRAGSQSTSSPWLSAPLRTEHPALSKDLVTDICVVGAGIAGLTTAYRLAREGRSVAVLDAGPVGGGETARTTAHLANALDDRYFELERIHGAEACRLAAGSHTAAIDEIESIVEREQIDCDFQRVDGFLFLPPKRSDRTLRRELAAAHRAGLTGVTMIDRAPIATFDTGPCLRFPRQAQFHPLKYLAGLADAVAAAGGRIFAGSRASKVEGGKAPVVEANGARVTASAVVVATNTPFIDIVSIHTKQYAYRTYALAAALTQPSAVPPGLYWDTLDPYHYVRVHGDLLIVGGEDHKTGQDPEPGKRFRRLERWARKRFPIGEVRYEWSGQVMETVDGLAFIGKDPGGLENVFIATGDSGMGMTHGTIAGLVLPELIGGRAHPWKDLYDPARVPVRAAGEYVRENVNVAAQYSDWVTGGDVDSVDRIDAESGAVIREGLHKVAVYRDSGGGLHRMSAVCTHLGCIVGWNRVEGTWDCPCHGSRFDKEGRVVNGPAVADLGPAPAKKIA